MLYAKHSNDEDFEEWNAEIAKGEYRFDRVDTEAFFLKRITKEEVIEVFKTSIIQNKKIVLVVVEGNDPLKTEELNLEHIPAVDFFEDFEQIEDIDEARSRFGFFDPTYINMNE